jgi:hypothetical protein
MEGGDITDTPEWQLAAGAVMGMEDEVKAVIAGGVDVNFQDKDSGMAPMLKAMCEAAEIKPSMIRLLLDAKVCRRVRCSSNLFSTCPLGGAHAPATPGLATSKHLLL